MIDCNSLNDFNPRLKAGRSAAMNKLEHTRLLLDCANPFWLLRFQTTIHMQLSSKGLSRRQAALHECIDYNRDKHGPWTSWIPMEWVYLLVKCHWQFASLSPRVPDFVFVAFGLLIHA